MIRITAVCKVPDEAEVVVERDVILDNPTLTLEVRRWEGCLSRSRSPTSHQEVSRKGRVFPKEVPKSLEDLATLCLLFLYIVLASSYVINPTAGFLSPHGSRKLCLPWFHLS